MDHFTPPELLLFQGNISEQWQKSKQELTLYLTAIEKDRKSDQARSSILLTCSGKKGHEIYNTFTFNSEEDKMKYEMIKHSNNTSSSLVTKKKISL